MVYIIIVTANRLRKCNMGSLHRALLFYYYSKFIHTITNIYNRTCDMQDFLCCFSFFLLSHSAHTTRLLWNSRTITKDKFNSRMHNRCFPQFMFVWSCRFLSVGSIFFSKRWRLPRAVQNACGELNRAIHAGCLGLFENWQINRNQLNANF